MRIGIGGFHHETNTFAPSRATWEAFAHTEGGWPKLVSGPALFDAVAGVDLPITGFIDVMGEHTLIPTTWAAASSSGHVTRDAYERITGLIIDGLRQALPLDGIYLDLHGAMVAEHLDDGEGELLSRIRALVGPTIPIVASLDVHANVTRAMIAHADHLICYRTYPHTAMAQTGQRVAQLLDRRLYGMPRSYVALRSIPYLISLCWQSTDIEPSISLYQRLHELESVEPSISLSFATGFPAADFPECAPTVWAYGNTQADADAAADAMERAVLNAEVDFDGKALTADEAVTLAVTFSRASTRPVIIADVQDNPGAGGSSDTTGILRALIRQGVSNAAIGLIVDPAAALAAHQMGEGKTIRLSLGGRSGISDDAPLEADYLVEKISDGRFDTHGAFYRGFQMNLGLSACLRLGGIRIVVASEKIQMADQEMFRFVGIAPEQEAILVLKSSAHFRADFTKIAQTTLVCASPGTMFMDSTRQPWKRLRHGIRMAPCGPSFESNEVLN